MYYRNGIGLFGVALIILGVVLLVMGGDAGTEALLESVCLRVGLVLCMAWLAWPELSRLPPAMVVAVGIGGLIVIRWKKAIFIIAPLLFAIWVLQPRGKHKNKKGGAQNPKKIKQ